MGIEAYYYRLKARIHLLTQRDSIANAAIIKKLKRTLVNLENKNLFF